MVIKHNSRILILKICFFLLLIISLIGFCFSIIKIDHSNTTIKIDTTRSIKTFIPKKEIEEMPIGHLTIPRINLSQPLYEINSPKNNIEENVTILKESSYPNLIILAAHSGYGEIAYFNNLDHLEIWDTIHLQYYDNNKVYEIEEIYKNPKNGFIHLSKKNTNHLILTTCDPQNQDYQIIISCKEKES